MNTKVLNSFTDFEDLINHPEFKSWCYGSDYNTVYVRYLDGIDVKYTYINGLWIN